MKQTTRQRTLYIATDFISGSLAWFLFNIIRYFTLPINYEHISLQTYLSMRTVLLGQLVFPLMMIFLFVVSGYYNKVFFKSRLDDITNSVGISLIGAIIIFFTALFNDKIDDRLGNLEMVLILWGLFAFWYSVSRLWITSYTSRSIWDKKIFFDTVIVGPADEANRLAKELETKHRNMGFRIVDVVKPHDEEKLRRLELDNDRKSYIIVPSTNNADETTALINRLLPIAKSVYLTPDSFMLITSRPRTSMVSGQVLVDVSKANIHEGTRNLKRIGDVFLSAFALIALMPVFGVLAILIKRDSKGPIIYKQERVGYKKKVFKIYKFRSMAVDAEANGPALSSTNDNRITRIGRILRKYRLDELPQFWNVLKGDMSLVGPRPERAYYLDQITERVPYYVLIHQVRPGITSWGMVKYGYASNIDQMVQRLKYDLLYVENVSFAVDMKILFYTVSTVVTGKGV